MKKYIVKEESKAERVDKFLAKELVKIPDFVNIPRSFVSKHIQNLVLVNNRSVKRSFKLSFGDEVYVDLALMLGEYERALDALEMESKIVPQKGSLNLVFENKNYIVLNKSHGIVVHPGLKNPKNTLANHMLGYLAEQGCCDKELKRAGIVHRLDKDVGGLIVFAKNRRFQKCLSEQFEKHEVLKIYYAKYVNYSKEYQSTLFKNKGVVKDLIEEYKRGNSINLDSWEKVEGIIKRDPKNRRRMVFCRHLIDENQRVATSYLLPLSKNEMFVLIKTGRMHQIRATFRSLGLILEGDVLYGYKGEKRNQISLKSVVLGFKDIDSSFKVFNIIDSVLNNGKDF